MRIVIQTIKHENQRYPTVGDYQYVNDDDHKSLLITVSDMGNKKYEWLVAIHEMIEQMLTEVAGITEEEITNFDLYYEKRREQGLVEEFSEPGFDANAPYKVQHQIATAIEMNLAALMGVDWVEYDRTVNAL